jgi:hypothetical protein
MKDRRQRVKSSASAVVAAVAASRNPSSGTSLSQATFLSKQRTADGREARFFVVATFLVEAGVVVEVFPSSATNAVA